MLAGNGMNNTYTNNPGSSIPRLTTNRLFIVDGIISLPIALAGFLFIPDVPETTRAFYLNKEVSSSDCERSSANVC